jgi:hypothetical protein
MPGIKPKVHRGSKRLGRDEKSVLQRMHDAHAAIETVSGKAPAHVGQSVQRSRADYWQEISGVVAESASYAASIVRRALAHQIASGDMKPIPGLKDMATVMAILVDKGAVIDQALATLGQTRGADIHDLEKRIALLLAAQSELQRRAADAALIDVTPEPDA